MNTEMTNEETKKLETEALKQVNEEAEMKTWWGPKKKIGEYLDEKNDFKGYLWHMQNPNKIEVDTTKFDLKEFNNYLQEIFLGNIDLVNMELANIDNNSIRDLGNGLFEINLGNGKKSITNAEGAMMFRAAIEKEAKKFKDEK